MQRTQFVVEMSYVDIVLQRTFNAVRLSIKICVHYMRIKLKCKHIRKKERKKFLLLKILKNARITRKLVKTSN